MTIHLPQLPDWWPAVAALAVSLLLLLWLLRAVSAKALADLLMRSAVENGRLSPRLLTTLFFVALTGYLEYKVLTMNRSEALLLVYVQVIFANIGLITVLLGLGKAADTFSKVQLEKKTPDTQINADTAEIKTGTVNLNTPPETGIE